MKAILLDFDGVLVDSATLYLDLYREACRRWNKTLPIDSVEEFRDWYNPRWEENYYEMGFSEEEFQEVLAWSAEHLDYMKAKLFPGVPETLRNLAAEYPLAVVSTTPSGLIQRRLAVEGLDGLLALIKGGDDGLSEKVEKIKDTLRQLGVQDGVMVGDTPLDVEAGRENGLRTVAVTYGWCSHRRVHDSRPDVHIDEPAQLETAIREALTRAR